MVPKNTIIVRDLLISLIIIGKIIIILREINRSLTIMVFLGTICLSEAATLNMQMGAES
jgi:hypothetical protein